MSKVQAATSIPPEVFSLSNGVFDADVLDVVELHNLAAFGIGLAHRLAGQVSGLDGWGTSGNEVATHQVTFPTTSGYTTRYTGQVYIDPDVTQLTCVSECTFPASNTGRVRFTVGGANVVNTHAAGSTTTTTGTLATSSTGTGLQTFTIEVDHQTGASPLCVLESWLIYCTPRTSGLPDPVE